MDQKPPLLRFISGQIQVAAQLTPGQVPALRESGITCLVNHRPDDEEPGQPAAADIARAATEAGLKVVHAPVRGLPDALGPDDKAVFFCRSGMRSAAAWAMAERLAGGDPETLRRAALAAGYDLGRVPL